jgi:hypothetical protein
MINGQEEMLYNVVEICLGRCEVWVSVGRQGRIEIGEMYIYWRAQYLLNWACKSEVTKGLHMLVVLVGKSSVCAYLTF